MALARLKKGSYAFTQARYLHQAVLSESSSVEFDSCPEHFLLGHAGDLTPSMVAQYIEKQTEPDLAYRLFSLAGRQTEYRHNADVYGALLRCLCKARQFDLVPSVFGSMFAQKCRAHGSTLGFVLKSLNAAGMPQASFMLLKKLISLGFEPARRTCIRTVWAFVKKDELHMAVQLLGEMKETGIYVDNILMGMVTNALCKAGRVDDAVRLVDDVVVKMPNSVDTVSLNGIVGYLCNEGRTSEASKLIEKMKVFNLFPDIVTYNKLMAGLCNSGHVDKALEMCHKMPGDSISPNMVTLNILLSGLCKDLRVDEAIQFFRKMSSTAGEGSYSYNILIHALCKQRRVRDAWNIASEMVRKGYSFTIHTYSAFIYCFVRLDDEVKAFELLQDMKERDIRGDSKLYKGLIGWLFKKGNVTRACELLAEMTENGSVIDEEIFNSIMSGLCKANRVLDALELGYEMMKSGCDWSISVFNPVLGTLCESGDKEQAFKLLDVLLYPGGVPLQSTYCAILRGLCIAKRFDDVRKLLAEMKKNGFDRDFAIYAAMLNANAHHVSGTVDLFAPLVGSNVVLKTGKYVSLLDGLFQTGEVEFALKVVKDLQRIGFKFSTSVFNVVIDGLCKNHMMREAQEYFVKMRDCGCSPDHITYTVLMYSFVAEGQLEVLELLYREMQADGCKPDAVAYSALLLGFAKGEKFKEFYGILNDMKEQGCFLTKVSLDSVFEHLRHKDKKRVKNYLKKEFGVTYDGEGLDSAENDEEGKTERISNKLGGRAGEHKGGEIQKLQGCEKPPICVIEESFDSCLKGQGQGPEFKKCIKAQSGTELVAAKREKNKEAASGCLSSYSPSSTNEAKMERSSKARNFVKAQSPTRLTVIERNKNNLSGRFSPRKLKSSNEGKTERSTKFKEPIDLKKAFKEVNPGRNKEQVTGIQLSQKKTTVSQSLTKVEICRKDEQIQKGTKPTCIKSSVTLSQKAFELDKVQKPKQQKLKIQ